MSDVGADVSLGFTHRKAKVTGTGKQTVDFHVGSGLFELISATMWAEKVYACPGEIAFNRKLGDGSYIGTGYQHGWISHLCGINTVTSRLVEGPGYFTAVIRNLEADAVMWFEIVYRRI